MQYFNTRNDCSAALPKLNQQLPDETPQFTGCVRSLTDEFSCSLVRSNVYVCCGSLGVLRAGGAERVGASLSGEPRVASLSGRLMGCGLG